jgi:hypothetical protein
MQPSTRLYPVGTTSLASLCVGLVLTAGESHRTLAMILSIVGALGMFACARMSTQLRATEKPPMSRIARP